MSQRSPTLDKLPARAELIVSWTGARGLIREEIVKLVLHELRMTCFEAKIEAAQQIKDGFNLRTPDERTDN